MQLGELARAGDDGRCHDGGPHDQLHPAALVGQQYEVPPLEGTHLKTRNAWNVFLDT